MQLQIVLITIFRECEKKILLFADMSVRQTWIKPQTIVEWGVNTLYKIFFSQGEIDAEYSETQNM